MEINEQTKSNLKEVLEQYVFFLNGSNASAQEALDSSTITSITPEGFVLALEGGLKEKADEAVNAFISTLVFGMSMKGQDVEELFNGNTKEFVSLLKSFYFEEKENQES